MVHNLHTVFTHLTSVRERKKKMPINGVTKFANVDKKHNADMNSTQKLHKDDDKTVKRDTFSVMRIIKKEVPFSVFC